MAGAKAKGGPVDQRKPYLVGEKGPEIFASKTPGYIFPSIAAFDEFNNRHSDTGEMEQATSLGSIPRRARGGDTDGDPEVKGRKKPKQYKSKVQQKQEKEESISIFRRHFRPWNIFILSSFFC